MAGKQIAAVRVLVRRRWRSPQVRAVLLVAAVVAVATGWWVELAAVGAVGLRRFRLPTVLAAAGLMGGRWHSELMEEQAVVLDLDLAWGAGADPHLLANGRKAYILLLLGSPPGREPRRVIPGDQFPFVHMSFAIVDFLGFVAVRAFGGPGTATLATHHLHGKGLLPNRAHQVINSQWIAYEERVDPVAPAFAGRRRALLPDYQRHYLFSFADEVLEFLAEDVVVERRVATQAEMLTELGHRLLQA